MIVQETPIREIFFTSGDLNGHVETSHYGFDSVHGGRIWFWGMK